MYPIYRKASAERDRAKGRSFLGYGAREILLDNLNKSVLAYAEWFYVNFKMADV